jgi:RNA polymerase sigma-70 factor (ECF subfamily)
MTHWRSDVNEWFLPSSEKLPVSQTKPAANTLVDEITFQTLFERMASPLGSYLRMLCRNSPLADDLLQETFLKFLRTEVPRLEGHQVKAYLYKTATSVFRDHWRSAERERKTTEAWIPQRESSGNPELSHDMERLFKTLDSRQQSLLWLAYVEGFSHSEIAAVLGLKEQSVKVVLLRARRQLAETLKAEGLGREERK